MPRDCLSSPKRRFANISDSETLIHQPKKKRRDDARNISITSEESLRHNRQGHQITEARDKPPPHIGSSNTVGSLVVSDSRVQIGNTFYQQEDRCLADLMVTDPRLDKKRIEDTKGPLLEESYRWVLYNDDFRRWRNHVQSQLLWIKGDPGKGKTMLLCGIVDELNHSATEAGPVAFFFCEATHPRANNATAVLRGLIYLLVKAQPLLISHLKEKYDHAGKQLFNDVNAWFALSEIFQAMVQDSCLQNMHFVIDALDECCNGLQHLLSFIILNVSTSRNVKWIISSRNKLEVEQQLKHGLGYDGSGIRLSLELNAKHVSHAVDAYINHKILQLKSVAGDDLREQVRTTVREKVNGTFLWVALAFQELRDARSWDILDVLEEMPMGLVSLYDRMLRQVQQQKRSGPEFCRMVLATMALAFRPLHLLELSALSGLPESVTSETRSVGEIVEMCGSFLTIQGDVVYIIHQSAQDYLVRNAGAILFPAGRSKVHHGIYSRSLKGMSMLRRDIYDLRRPGCLIDEATAVSNLDTLCAVRYSCVYWIDHFCNANAEDSKYSSDLCNDGPILLFMKTHFLHWMESLALLRQFSDGAFSMRKLWHATQTSSCLTSHLAGFLNDAEKFALTYGPIIERAPLQVYGCALVFSPTMSKVKEQYWKDRLSFIKSVKGVRNKWDSLLQTFEGHEDSVTAVAFSPDGRTVASASEDKTVRLWSSTTGAEMQILRGHSGPVSALAFSSDGQTIVSASRDKTVCFWDSMTGRETQRLHGLSHPVSALAFKPNTRTIALATHHGDIRLWNPAAEENVWALRTDGGGTYAVVFSPNGLTLASARGDGTIWLRDSATGAEIQTLKGLCGPIYAVAFSSDGRTIASASHDMTIQLWDAAMATVTHKLMGHDGPVYAIAFSIDGRVVASASGDMTIKFWDAACGKNVQTLRGHSGSVQSFAFSPDGRVIASASNDKTIRLWDAVTILDTGTDDDGVFRPSGSTINYEDYPDYRHSSLVAAIVFSPDGRRVASASHDKSIWLWDAASGVVEHRLWGHGDIVHSVTFSPDSQMVASASNDGTVRLWKAASGAKVWTLWGHAGPVHAVAFSPDGSIIASGSRDKTVLVWDVASGIEVRRLQDHTGPVYGVTFSTDGTIVASASHDKTVKLRPWSIRFDPGVQVLRGHSGRVSAIAFSTDGRIFASGSRDKTIRLWDARSGAEVRTIQGHGGPVNAIAFSPDGKIIASGSLDKKIRVWDVASGIQACVLRGHSKRVSSIAFSPDGRTLASGSRDKTVRLWDIATGAAIRTLEHGYAVYPIAFSPDGLTLASGSRDKALRLWNIATGAAVQILEGHSGSIQNAAFTPDGHVLLSTAADNTVRLWSNETGRESSRLGPQSGRIYAISLSQSGQLVSLASSHGTVQVWDTVTGKVLQTFTGHGPVSASAFSPDGWTVASAPHSPEGHIRLWNTKAGSRTKTLRGHSDWVYAVALSSDDSTVASASADGTIRLWDAENGRETGKFEVNLLINNLSFSGDRCFLDTDRGRMWLGSKSTGSASAIVVEDEWITQDGERVLLLPTEYRATSAALHRNRLVLGHTSGQVSFLDFDPAGLEKVRMCNRNNCE